MRDSVISLHLHESTLLPMLIGLLPVQLLFSNTTCCAWSNQWHAPPFMMVLLAIRPQRAEEKTQSASMKLSYTEPTFVRFGPAHNDIAQLPSFGSVCWRIGGRLRTEVIRVDAVGFEDGAGDPQVGVSDDEVLAVDRNRPGRSCLGDQR